jgi:DNA modification methylase
MQVQQVSTDKLIPYCHNPRKNDQAIKRMVASLREFGFRIPVLARSDGEVIDGHLRLKAAKKLGMTEVPVILCDDWSTAQVKAFRLIANRSANWAEWDLELVAFEMQGLKALEFDLTLTGFDGVEIDGFLFRNADESSSDVVPDAPVTAVTRIGDLWRCGSHRVLCGDATSSEAAAALLGDVRPVVMITDAPYGVQYNPNWRESAGLGRQRQTGAIPNDDRVDWSQAYKLFPGDVAYIWHAGVHAAEVGAGIEAAGFRIRSQIIWVKQHFALSRGDYHWGHEPCSYCVREGKSSNWCGDRTQSTVWRVANLNPFGGSKEPATGHSAQKPIELMRRPILNNSKCGDIIYDPFLGSGTTLIAAELTDRVSYGLEIDPRYVDVIVTRWQTLSGKNAVLENDGRSFQQVSEQGRESREEPPCPGLD